MKYTCINCGTTRETEEDFVTCNCGYEFATREWSEIIKDKQDANR